MALGTAMESPLHSPSEIFVEQYKAAAAEGAIVELKLRLLADKIPELQKYAHAQRLEDIETEVAQHFGCLVSEQDKNTLSLCRQLRNKVLHCDFRAARDKLEELGNETQHGGVKAVAVSGLSLASMVEKIRGAVAGVEGMFQYVADTSSTDPSSVFGWLLELGAAGDFRAAVDAFRNASAIVDRLSVADIGGTSA